MYLDPYKLLQMVKWSEMWFMHTHFISQRCSRELCLSSDVCCIQVVGAVTSPSKPTQPFPAYLCFQLPFLSKVDLLLNTSFPYQRGPFSFCSTSGRRVRVMWLSVTLGRNRKIRGKRPDKRPSREMDRQHTQVKTGGCVVGKGECAEGGTLTLPEEKQGALGETVLQSAERAWPGRAQAGHAWLSSTLCPCRDVLFSWQHLLLLYTACDRSCCFSLGRRYQSLPSSFPTVMNFSAHITGQLHHEVELQPSPVSRKAGITSCSSNLQSGGLKMPRCILYPRFQSMPHG